MIVYVFFTIPLIKGHSKINDQSNGQIIDQSNGQSNGHDNINGHGHCHGHGTVTIILTG